MASTFYNQIAANKRNSRPARGRAHRCCSAALGLTIGYGLSGSVGWRHRALIVAVTSAISCRSRRTSRATSSSLPRPRPSAVTEEELPQLFNVVRELTIAANIPMPRVYVIDDTSMNAFATGRDPGARLDRGHHGPAQPDGPRGGPGRHRPRAVARPQLRHPVRAARRRPGRQHRPAGRLLPALHVLGRSRPIERQRQRRGRSSS